MRALWACLATATLLRRRALLDLPNLHEQTPESVVNVLDYAVAQPTPAPAAFDGMFCRGGACQYRVPAPLPTILPTPPVPPVYPRSSRELCRGLACLPGMGKPADNSAASWLMNCTHLYIDLGGGLAGTDGARTVADAKLSFYKWCKLKFPPEVAKGMCEGLGDVVTMALRGAGEAPDVGAAGDICYAGYLWTLGVRQATVDLRLLRSTLPKLPALVQLAPGSFLPSVVARGGGDLGPNSPRGRAWRAVASRAYAGRVSARGQAMLQSDPAFKPDYNQDPPCLHSSEPMPKVQLNNAIPPAEMAEDLFEFCAGTFAEVMLGFAQTGDMVVTMVNDWCSWQSSVSNWVAEAEVGHPDWDFRRCKGMQDFVAFALRNDLTAGLGPKDVCRRVFLAMGDVEWMATAVDTAWAAPALRRPPATALATAGDSEGMKEVLKLAAEYAEKLFGKLRKQKDMYDNLNGVKMDKSAFSLVRHPAPTLPPLPDFSELDVNPIPAPTHDSS